MAKEPRIYNGEKTVFWMNGGGKTEQPYAKNDSGPVSYTIHKN